MFVSIFTVIYLDWKSGGMQTGPCSSFRNCAPFHPARLVVLVYRSLRGHSIMRAGSTAHTLTLNGPNRTGRTAQVVVSFIQDMLEEARSEASRTGAILEELGAVEDILELFEIALLPEPNNSPFPWGTEGTGWHQLVFLSRRILPEDFLTTHG